MQTDWPGHSRGSAEYRRILVALFCAGVATFAQLYSPQSILAVISNDVGVSPADAALTISVATGAVAVGVIPWAIIAGRFGRARTMSIAVTLSAVTGCLVLLAPTFEILLVGRAIEGFMLAAIPAVAVAYLAEEIVAEHSPVAAGVYVAGTTVGGLLGRVAAGPIAEFAGWRIAMLAVAIVCLIAAVAFVVLIPRPRRGAVGTTGREFMVRVVRSLRRPLIVVLYVQPFLLMGAFVALYNYIGFRLEAPPFLFSTTAVAMLYFAYLAGTWSSSRTGAWVQRWGFRRTLLLAQAAMLLGIGITILPVVPVIIAGVVLLTAGFFASHSAVAAWIPLAAPDAAGEASAVYSLSYYLGSSVLGWLVGFVFIAGGWPATVVALVAVVALAAVLAMTVRSRGSVTT